MSSCERIPPPTCTGTCTARQIASTRLRLFAFAERGIEVHDVQAARAFRLEAGRHLGRLVRVGRLVRGVSLHQANRATAAEIDGGDHDHASDLTNRS